MARDDEIYDPDLAHEQANKPDDFGFFNEMSLGSHQQAQLFKAQRDEANAILDAVIEDYGITETREEIKQRMADVLTIKVRESLDAPEGFNALRRETMKHYGIGAPPKDPMDESVNAFTAAQRRRFEADRKMFEPPEEE